MMNLGVCPKDGARLLAAAGHDDRTRLGDHSTEVAWCPVCKGTFTIKHYETRPHAEPSAAAVTSLAAARDVQRGTETEPMRLPYELKVARDGTVLVSVGGFEPVAISPDYAYRLSAAFSRVAYHADREQHRLRGADRWLVTAHKTRPKAIRVAHDDKVATFIQIQIRKARECNACRTVSPGPVMWREERISGKNVPWTSWVFGDWARLCSACATPVVLGISHPSSKAGVA